MNFKQLREKSVKGMELRRYIINPTPFEIAAFILNTKFNAVRLLEHENTLYAWDAYFATHIDFANAELGQKYTHLTGYTMDRSGVFDVTGRSGEENSFGDIIMDHYESQILAMMKQIEKISNGKFIDRTYKKNWGTTWTWKQGEQR